MYKSIQKKVKSIYRNLKYLLITGLLALSIILVNTNSIQSKNSPENIIRQREEIVDIADLEKFSKMIGKLEEKWERDYEGYFNRDFSSSSRSAKQISEHLAEVSQQAGIKPAVIWAVPKDDFLQLMLITPGEQFVTKKVWGGNKERLNLRIEEFEAAIADRQSLKIGRAHV